MHFLLLKCSYSLKKKIWVFLLKQLLTKQQLPLSSWQIRSNTGKSWPKGCHCSPFFPTLYLQSKHSGSVSQVFTHSLSAFPPCCNSKSPGSKPVSLNICHRALGGIYLLWVIHGRQTETFSSEGSCFCLQPGNAPKNLGGKARFWGLLW